MTTTSKPDSLPSNEQVEPRPSDERNGCFLDGTWCCKVCDGEIPDGHTEDCYIWKLEKKHRDFLAKEYSAVLTERDQLRAALAARTAPETCEQPKNWAIWRCYRHDRLFAAHAGCSLCAHDPDRSSSNAQKAGACKHGNATGHCQHCLDAL